MNQVTTLQASMHLLKAYVGTGILAMPKAFSYSGFVLGLIFTPIVGILFNLSCHMLVDINKQLCLKLDQNEIFDYKDLAELSFKNGPLMLRKFSNISRRLLITLLMFLQMGGCAAYSLFMAENMRQFFMNVTNLPGRAMAIQYYLLIILPFAVIANFNKNVKLISFASMCANVIQIASFGIIFYNLVQDIPPISNETQFGTQLPLFFSTVFFTFEGLQILMPLVKSMKHPDDLSKPFGVLNIVLVIVVCLYILMGVLGYFKYGNEVADVVTLSLANETLYNCLQIMFSVVIFVNYMVQMYIAIELVWSPVDNYLSNFKLRTEIRYLLDLLIRTILVFITFFLAAIVPQLSLIISLVGAISGGTIFLMYPAVLHSVLFWHVEMNRINKIWIFTRNTILFLFGLIGLVLGTYYSIDAIVKTFV